MDAQQFIAAHRDCVLCSYPREMHDALKHLTWLADQAEARAAALLAERDAALALHWYYVRHDALQRFRPYFPEEYDSTAILRTIAELKTRIARKDCIEPSAKIWAAVRAAAGLDGGQRRYPVDVGRDTHARLIEIATRERLTRGGLPSPSQAIAWVLDRLERKPEQEGEMSPTQREPINSLTRAAMVEVQHQRDTIAELVAMLRQVVKTAPALATASTWGQVSAKVAIDNARALLDRLDASQPGTAPADDGPEPKR